MDRRTFVGAAACSLVATAHAVRAQPVERIRRIGVLAAGTVDSSFLSANLRELGSIEGRNVIVERRSADGKAERVPVLAAELIRDNVEVIVAFGAVASVAVRNATSTITIVATTGDPIVLGLVTNLSRPGGNITGVTTIAPELAAKRLELVRAMFRKPRGSLSSSIRPINISALPEAITTRSFARSAWSRYSWTWRHLRNWTGRSADVSRQRVEAVIVGRIQCYV